MNNINNKCKIQVNCNNIISLIIKFSLLDSTPLQVEDATISQRFWIFWTYYWAIDLQIEYHISVITFHVDNNQSVQQ